MRKTKMKRSGADIVVKVLLVSVCIILLLYTISMLSMLFWGVITSLKSPSDFRNDFDSNMIGFPRVDDVFDEGVRIIGGSYKELFRLKNYVDFFTQYKYVRKVSFFQGEELVVHSVEPTIPLMLFNSLFYALGNGLIQAIVPAIMGYMCAKYAYKFSKIIYTVVLITMTLPIVGAYPSELTFLRNAGLYDTWLGTFVQRFSFTGMYFLVFFEYFKGMSDTYSEAADIDGASQWTIMTKIYMPLAAKMIGSVFLIKFIFFWNDFASIELYMPTHPSLAYFIYAMQYDAANLYRKDGADVTGNTPAIFAACMVLALPTILIFLLFQNKIMGSMTLGGIKE